MALDATAYASQLKQLLPRGRAWVLHASSWISKTLLAVGDELARVDGRGADIIDESDPRTATETLDEWEAMLGLPDECIETIPATDADRQVAITQKLVGVPDVTPAGFEALALACGYEATVDDSYGSLILRAGFRAGDRVYGLEWSSVFSLEVSPPAGAALSHAELECIIERAAPAHTYVFFEYLP